MAFYVYENWTVENKAVIHNGAADIARMVGVAILIRWARETAGGEGPSRIRNKLVEMPVQQVGLLESMVVFKPGTSQEYDRV